MQEGSDSAEGAYTVNLNRATSEIVVGMELQKNETYLCLAYADIKVCQYFNGHTRTVENGELQTAIFKSVRNQKTGCALA